jgi:hypothetical protein
MKAIRKNVFFCAALSAVLVPVLFSIGCASGPQSKPKQKTEMLDWKNAGLGQAVPEWVLASGEDEISLQNLPNYKNDYCFIVQEEGADGTDATKDYVTGWVGNLANGAARVATLISTTVNTTAEAGSAQIKDAAKEAHQVEIRNAMSNASFNGFRKTSDFWVLAKNNSTSKEYYVAYALWTIDRKRLDDQIAANIQNILDNNTAISAAERTIYLDIITDIRTRGIASISGIKLE